MDSFLRKRKSFVLVYLFYLLMNNKYLLGTFIYVETMQNTGDTTMKYDEHYE